MENQQEQMENLSPEQLAARKEEMKKFFEDALPYLKAQAEYEKLLAEISENKLKRLQYDHQYAISMYQINNPDTLEEDLDEEGVELEGRVNPETAKRKLKKN
jgi:threonyl-tRNA synthetase